MATVLITGASRGLGLEFARQYAGEGWRVIATCRNPESTQELRNIGPGVEVHKLDVTNRTAIALLADALRSEALDVLIANAGVMSSTRGAQPWEIADGGWMEDFCVNTVAPLMCASAFVPHVTRSEQRKMIAISSWIGSIGSNVTGGHYLYRASKSALNAVWRSFAIDHPEVIAVALSPGPLRTDMTRYDSARWEQLPQPTESISCLRSIIDRLTHADSGSFIHVNGERLPW